MVALVTMVTVDGSASTIATRRIRSRSLIEPVPVKPIISLMLVFYSSWGGGTSDRPTGL
jgi:hypothetical protein